MEGRPDEGRADGDVRLADEIAREDADMIPTDPTFEATSLAESDLDERRSRDA